jgi:hypothetical protein
MGYDADLVLGTRRGLGRRPSVLAGHRTEARPPCEKDDGLLQDYGDVSDDEHDHDHDHEPASSLVVGLLPDELLGAPRAHRPGCGVPAHGCQIASSSH